MSQRDDYIKAIEEIVAKDPRYRPSAYLFVSEAVTHTAKKLGRRKGPKKHITGQELLQGIRELALQRFGPLTLDVLHEWGVRETQDFGNVVFALVGNRLLGASEEDSLGDFANGYDFEDAFAKPFREPDGLPGDLPPLV